jgi:hypothetical protein
MGELKKEEKEPLPGLMARTQILQRLGSVIQRVGSYLKTGGSQLVKLKDPRPLGKLEYRVTLPLGSVSFAKLSEARSMKRLLATSLSQVDSVIIRTDTTDEGYVASEREIK